VQITRALSDAIIDSSRKPLVFISTSAIGYYGDSGEAPMGEQAPHGSGFLAEVCLEWENAAKLSSGTPDS